MLHLEQVAFLTRTLVYWECVGMANLLSLFALFLGVFGLFFAPREARGERRWVSAWRVAVALYLAITGATIQVAVWTAWWYRTGVTLPPVWA